MTGLIAAISVAVIGGPVMWVLHRFDRRNTTQHQENFNALERIDAKLDRHDDKLDRLNDRLEQHTNDQRKHR